MVLQSERASVDIEKDAHLNPGWVVSKVQHPLLEASFFVKGTFRLRPGGAAEPVGEDDALSADGDAPFDDGPAGSLRYGNDFAPFKAKADFLVVGSCHAPGARPVEACTATIHLGSYSKSVAVIGDRVWSKGRMSEPTPFTRMPLRYDLAFGGEGFAKNPVGRGHKSDRLPNIEDPRRLIGSPKDTPDPAGFGPVPWEWGRDYKKLGTYDKGWLKERWPWYPPDFDWSYFNRAPVDQQIDAYFRGDEELRFENMHPEHPDYRCRLPGLRARCFVSKRTATDEEWSEVKLVLDTLWVDLDQELLVLVWRGRTPVSTVKTPEVEKLYLVTEPLSSEPGSPEHHRAEWDRRRAEEVEEEEPPPAGPTPEEEAAEDEKFEKEMAAAEEEIAKAEEEAKKLEAQAKEQMIAAGVDPNLLEKAPPKSLKESQAEIAKAIEELKAQSPEIADKLKDLQPPDLSEIEALEKEAEELEKEMGAEEEPEPWTRERVEEGVRSGKDFTGQDLSGLDLSGLDLSGAKFAQARLSKAKLAKTKLSGGDLGGADLGEADLSEADLGGASLDGADLSKSTFEKAVFTGASIQEADLSDAEGPGADFSGIQAFGTDFSHSKLAGAKFVKACLPSADFTAADLAQADFSQAEMKAACIEEAQAPGIVMDGADLTGLHASDKPNCAGGRFRGVRADGSNWMGAALDGADFTGASLLRSDFSECSLNGAVFDRANMKGSDLSDARMQRIQMLEANLCQTGFERSDVTGGTFVRSNLYEADFWDATTKDANFQDANLNGTKLLQR